MTLPMMIIVMKIGLEGWKMKKESNIHFWDWV